ncbi:hypothetical protein DFH29DRAFT_378093 [Suillus ampliporus]|nr:hypothetical protein DFH29DRAFT_378093 [Suillus ampliporus]
MRSKAARAPLHRIFDIVAERVSAYTLLHTHIMITRLFFYVLPFELFDVVFDLTVYYLIFVVGLLCLHSFLDRDVMESRPSFPYLRLHEDIAPSQQTVCR